MDTIKIAWMFPDTLYLHGDRGNILALERFAKLAGLESTVEKIDFNSSIFEPMNYDIIYCPSGEVSSFPQIIEWLAPYKEKLVEFIDAGKILLTIGTTISVFTDKVVRTDGSEFNGLGILSVKTVEREEVYGDDNYFVCKVNDKEIEAIGNQIQMVDYVSEVELPFAQLKYGFGNTGRDTSEGFKKNNSIFTNTLGPLLVTNPMITKELIKIIATNKGIQLDDFVVDMDIEEKSFATKKDFILNKVTRLTNCKIADK